MTTKYTPGKWYVAGSMETLRIQADSTDEKSCDGTRQIALVRQSDYEFPDYGEAEGNAQLMAAAPELAEALNECLKALDVAFEFEGDVFGKHHNDAVDALQNARHALQKAGLVS